MISDGGFDRADTVDNRQPLSAISCRSSFRTMSSFLKSRNPSFERFSTNIYYLNVSIIGQKTADNFLALLFLTTWKAAIVIMPKYCALV